MEHRRFDQRGPASSGRGKFWVAGGVCIALVLLVWWWSSADAAVDPKSDQRITVKVEQGMTASAVADALKEQGLIRSTLKFRWIASHEGLASKLKAGSYVFEPSQTTEDIITELAGGKQQEVVVTIPEGYTVKDIDSLLARLGLSATGSVIDCANTCAFTGIDFLPPKAGLAKRGGRIEGYLYADTYFVDPSGFDVEAFLARLLRTFKQRVIDTHTADIQASGRSLNDIVTMASLIEKETRNGDERPTVAGILWKRLDNQIGLQVDATVRYIIDKPTADITVQDLQTDSPYNTRKYRGLPPGPISSPSLSSIEAALHPKDSPYLYYLHDAQGVIHYARTNDEQNENKVKYLD